MAENTNECLYTAITYLAGWQRQALRLTPAGRIPTPALYTLNLLMTNIIINDQYSYISHDN